MPRIKRITERLLNRRRACQDSIYVFNAVFPQGAAITFSNVFKALRRGLEVRWVAQRFLGEGQLELYNKGEDELDKRRDAEMRKLNKLKRCGEKRKEATLEEYDRRGAKLFMKAWRGKLKSTHKGLEREAQVHAVEPPTATINRLERAGFCDNQFH